MVAFGTANGTERIQAGREAKRQQFWQLRLGAVADSVAKQQWKEKNKKRESGNMAPPISHTLANLDGAQVCFHRAVLYIVIIIL